METEPPAQPPEEDSEAKVLPFKHRGVETPEEDLHEAMRRHPSRGKETPQETLGRLGLNNDGDDDPDAS